MDALIYQKMAEVAQARQAKDPAKEATLKEATNTRLGAHFASPVGAADLAELAYDVTSVAWRDAMAQDVTPQIIEVKSVGLADVDYIDQFVSGMMAYWQGKGGQILSGTLRGDRSQMPREEMVGAIDIHDDEIATNFWGSLDKLRNQVQEKVRQLPPRRLIQLVQAAVTEDSNPQFYGEFAASTLGPQQVDPILRAVSQRSGGQVKIVGTPTAIQLFSNLGLQFGDNVQQQLFQTGVIGSYKSVGIVQVENWLDFADNWQLPDDEVYIVGRNAGRLTYYGNTPKSQILARPSFYKRWETARDAGMLLYGASRGRLGRIKLT